MRGCNLFQEELSPGTKCFGAITLLLLMLVAGAVRADSPVVTSPVQVTTQGGDASGTVTVTNTFQKVFSATPSVAPGARKGCTVQNNGSHVMYVTGGAPLTGAGASSTTNSYQLTAATTAGAGGVYYCGYNGTVEYGQINITGTSGDAFTAKQY